jgi:deazaflavin-dependent oxidoreductase (nitroreductase family)
VTSELPDPGSTARAREDVKPIPLTVQRWLKPLMRVMSVANVASYRLTSGRVGGRFLGGAPVCLVTMRGRRSGKQRTLPLIYVAHGEDVILVASQGGMEKHPLWYHNLKADPNIEVQVGGVKRRLVARQVDDAEKKALWPVLTSVYPDFEDYQARTHRNIPVFVCSPP